MILRRLPGRVGLQRILVPLGIVGPLGMLVVLGLMLVTMRQVAWNTADQASKNLLQVLAHDIAHDIASYDLSIQGAIDNLNAPGLRDISPVLRQLVIFDRAANANNKGLMLVLDPNGDIAEDLRGSVPHKGNFADRDYFQVHKDRADVGLFISKPLVSRVTGLPSIVLSRRINRPDGSFGGVVVGTMKLDYFTGLFARAKLGPDDAIALFRDDGTRIARYPFVETDIGASVAGTTIFQRVLDEGQGSFTARSPRDQVERRYTFAHVGDLPLILNVGMATDPVESRWRGEAFIIASVSILLCGSTIGLVLWSAREFRRRMAAERELEHLSVTDALTAVPNRRRFDEVFAGLFSQARREDTPLCLLIVDADRFKRINDRFGHQTGDEVLKGLARCLTAVAHRETDLVCRLGGEEFALLLPDTDVSAARKVAEQVHWRLAHHRAWPAETGPVTVSIGIASSETAAVMTAADLYATADAALYEAKAAGRNQTCCAGRADAPGPQDRPALYVVRNP